MKEIWKDVKNYEGLYQVSSLGRVKSLARKGRGYKVIKERMLKTENKIRVHLTKGYNCDKKLIYKLVIQAFTNSSEEDRIIHINGIKTDNSLENLKVISKKIKPVKSKKVTFIKFGEGCKIKTSINGHITYSKTFKTKLDATIYYDKVMR